MTTSSQPVPQVQQRRPVAPLTVVLAVIMTFFCAILIFVYIETRRANPVMLDQQGHPLGSPAQRSAE